MAAALAQASEAVMKIVLSYAAEDEKFRKKKEARKEAIRKERRPKE